MGGKSEGGSTIAGGERKVSSFYNFGVGGELLAAGGLKERQYGPKAWKPEAEAGAKE